MVDVIILSIRKIWIGYRSRSVLSVINEIIEGYKSEIMVTLYVISYFKVVECLKNAIKRGISVKKYMYLLYASRWFVIIKKFFRLGRGYRYPNIYIIKNGILHAKILTENGCNVIIKSTKMSFGGSIKNYYFGFLVKDYYVVQKVLPPMLG
ncbi:MAG: hypothetical protein ACP5RZ_04785 [Thermoplasmata archaeon]